MYTRQLVWIFCSFLGSSAEQKDTDDGLLNSTTYQSCHEDFYRGILARSLVFNSSTILKGTTASIGAKKDLCSSENYGCQNKRNQGSVPRVAHCIAGSARTLWHPRVYKRLQDNFIDALGGNYTTFMYLKLTDSKSLLETKQHIKTFAPKLDSLSAALAYMKPYKVIFAPEKNPSVYGSRESGCSLIKLDPEIAANLIGQLDTLRDCYRMIEDYEEVEGARFDFVTRIRPDSAVLRAVQSIHTLTSAKIYLPTRDDGNIDHIGIFDHVGIFGRSFSDELFLRANRFYNACPGGFLTWLEMNSRGPKIWAEKRPEILTKIPIPVILIRASPEDMETVCRNWVKIHPAIFGGTETSVWTQWLNKAQDKCLNETTLLTGVADALHSTFNLSASVRPNSDLPPPPFYSKKCEGLFAGNGRKAALIPLFP
mmetsp:Transcript_27894/g.57320  ORF Transcript_27894/g.57320 Transcript_27894/m.57320 type:complete len:425 (+) Transcript_27894:264-1538(+)